MSRKKSSGWWGVQQTEADRIWRPAFRETCKIISVFNVFQNILLIAWLISFIISIVELYMHYPLTNHSIRFGRDRRILTPIIMPVAVMMGEYIGGLSKIGGTVFTTFGWCLCALDHKGIYTVISEYADFNMAYSIFYYNGIYLLYHHEFPTQY